MSKLVTMSGPIFSSLPGRSDSVSMVGGMGALGYQLLASHTYSWVTFLSSSILIVVGAACGFAQARYHRYLFKTFPEVYAAKIEDSCGSTQQEGQGRAGGAVNRASWAWLCHGNLHCRSGF